MTIEELKKKIDETPYDEDKKSYFIDLGEYMAYYHIVEMLESSGVLNEKQEI